jgi:hypothetical protein
LTKAPEPTFIAADDPDTLTLVFPDNPRLNLPGLKFHDAPSDQTLSSTKDEGSTPEAMSYRDLITSSDAMPLIFADPTLSPIHGVKFPIPQNVDSVSEVNTDVGTSSPRPVNEQSITDTSRHSEMITQEIRAQEGVKSSSQQTDAECMTQESSDARQLPDSTVMSSSNETSKQQHTSRHIES